VADSLTQKTFHMKSFSRLLKKNGVLSLLFVIITTIIIIAASVPTTITDMFLPGSQPGESGGLNSPSICQSCHGGYDITVEPFFNWRGSMMAQAARDPLYAACLTISNQDAPFAGDLCIRCHAPEGWLGGRSTPTDGSALTSADKEGVHCDFCHRMVKPTEIGINPFPSDQFYTDNTYPEDQQYLATLSSIPASSGNGSYIVDSDETRRGPFTDAGAKHKFYYSPFHSEAAFCGTCHDVSNPVYSRNPDNTYSANSFDQHAPLLNTYDLFPVERTYSEWLMSDYNTPGGVYSPVLGGNKQYVSTCQDCHLRDVSGVAAKQTSAVYRDNLPLHDMTGGNTFTPGLVGALYPGDVDRAALDSGIMRARYMLRNATTLDLKIDNVMGNLVATVKVTNETGHKLPSGYPEGRRIWINLVAKDNTGTVVYESGHYDNDTGVLTEDSDIKLYQIKPGLDATIASLTGFNEGPGFHFVLNNKIFFDNRIPPRGFTNANFESIQSPPVGYSYADGQYWDETVYQLPPEATMVAATLFYQATSKEYIDFLQSENTTNNTGQVLHDLWSANGKSAPEIMNTESVLISPTSVNDYEVPSLTVFPNPSSDGWITIRFPGNVKDSKMYLSVVSLSGFYELRARLIEVEGGITRVNIGTLKPGQYIYILESVSGKGMFRGQFVVR
jgi:hypothetical protein